MQCYTKGSYDKIICSLYWNVIRRYSVVKELHLLFNLNCLFGNWKGYAIAFWKKLLNMSKFNHFNKTSLFSLTSYLLISKSSFLSVELQSDKERGRFYFGHHLGICYYVNFLGRLGSNGFQIKWKFGTHSNWKKQNPGGRFGATS